MYKKYVYLLSEQGCCLAVYDDETKAIEARKRLNADFNNEDEEKDLFQVTRMEVL